MDISFQFDYFYIGLFAVGWLTRLWQEKAAISFYLCLIAIVIALAWFFSDDGNAGELGNSSLIQTCSNSDYFYNQETGELNICITKSK